MQFVFQLEILTGRFSWKFRLVFSTVNPIWFSKWKFELEFAVRDSHLIFQLKFLTGVSSWIFRLVFSFKIFNWSLQLDILTWFSSCNHSRFPAGKSSWTSCWDFHLNFRAGISSRVIQLYCSWIFQVENRFEISSWKIQLDV